MRKKTLWITRTALFLAILVLAQLFGSRLGGGIGQQLITGSLVNLVLVIAGITAGYASGLTVALLSPVLAFLIGVGPKFMQVVPVIMLGNAVIALVGVLVFRACSRMPSGRRYAFRACGLVAAAGVKACVLYVGVVLLVLPMLSVPDAAKATLSLMFSWPQFVTGSMGGVLAVLLAPSLLRAQHEIV